MEYVLVWEFRVRPEARDAFEQLYGPEGAWVKLFREAPGFRGTELLRDEKDPGRYLTLDRWESPASYAAFREHRAADYLAIDQLGEGLTAHERFLGEFDVATTQM